MTAAPADPRPLALPAPGEARPPANDDYVNPLTPLALRDAERAVRDAARRFEELLMAEARQILRVVFPDAGQIIVGLHEHREQAGSVWLLAVHDRAGETLWALPHWADQLRKQGGGADLPTATPRALAEGRSEEDALEVWDARANDVTSLVEIALEFSEPESLGWREADPDFHTGLEPFLIRLP